jgi:hypothetical protein
LDAADSLPEIQAGDPPVFPPVNKTFPKFQNFGKISCFFGQLLFSNYQHLKILGSKFIVSGESAEFCAKYFNFCKTQCF